MRFGLNMARLDFAVPLGDPLTKPLSEGILGSVNLHTTEAIYRRRTPSSEISLIFTCSLLDG
jgi:hypothetical protein